MRMRETPPSEYVLEIVTPRTNAARLSPAEHFFSTLALQVGDEATTVIGRCSGQHWCKPHRNRNRRIDRRSQLKCLLKFGQLGREIGQLLRQARMHAEGTAHAGPQHVVNVARELANSLANPSGLWA